MIILPAIDIKDGNCVRLFKGDFSTVEKVAADYMETAKGFEKAGASWIHMVDLDGAKEGKPVNTKIYKDVVHLPLFPAHPLRHHQPVPRPAHPQRPSPVGVQGH